MKCRFYFNFNLFINYKYKKTKFHSQTIFKLIKNYYYSYTNTINTHYVIQPNKFLLLYLNDYDYTNILVNISLKK